MGLLLLTAAVTAPAQNVFSMKDTTIQANTTVATLELALDNTDKVTAMQFDLVFPKSLTFKSNAVQLNSERANGHELKMAEQTDGSWRFVITEAQNNPLEKNSGTLLSLPVSFEEGFTNGKLTMKNVMLTNHVGDSLYCENRLGTIFLQTIQKKSIEILGLEQIVSTEKPAEISWKPANIPLNPSYYINEDCTTQATEYDRKTVGTKYVVVNFAGNDTLYALEDTFALVITNKKQIDLTVSGTVLPTASPILQGQPLSTSILSDGYAIIASATDTFPLHGSFTWVNGNESVQSSGQYAIIFTPEDDAYAQADAEIPLTVIPVYDVFVQNPENGSISATGLNSNNRYAHGQKLKLKAFPNANYKFANWSNGVTTDTTTWTVSGNGSISATFAPIMHTVSFSATGNGKLSIKEAGGSEVVTGSQVQQGTELLITLEPGYDEKTDTDYKLESLTLNGEPFTSGKFILGQEDVSFAASFVVAENESPVVVNETQNGVLRLYKADGTAIPSGTAMKDGETVQVMALPNAGYEVEEVCINEEPIQPNAGTPNIFTFTTDDGALVEASFSPKTFHLTLAGKSGSITVKNGDQTLTNGAGITYGSTVTIEQPTANDGYVFRSLVVNGRKIETFPYAWTVSSDVNVAAVFEELTMIKDSYIINTKQRYKFNNQDKRFQIYTTQTYASDFNIAYSKNGQAIDGVPVKAGTYSMQITRPADNIYKAYESLPGYFDNKLEIEKAKMTVTKAPTSTEDRGTASIDTLKVEIETKGNISKYTYYPKDEENYEPVSYFLSTGKEVTIISENVVWNPNEGAEGVRLKSSRMATKAGAEEMHGYVKVSNGGLAYDAENGNFSIPEGTTITLTAIPETGYRFTGWDGNNSSESSITVDVEEDLTLPKAMFDTKKKLKAALKAVSSVYNGKMQEVTVTNIKDARIRIYADRECNNIAELKNVGTYWISVYRDATDDAEAVRDTLEYTITPATPVVTSPTTAPIAAGETLTQVQLLGGNAGIVPGTFSWVDSTVIVAEGKASSYKALFTSADPNYNSTEVNVTIEGLGVKSTEPDPTPNPDPDPTPDPDPDTPTSIEEIASETLLVVREGALEIHPANQVEVAVVSLSGKYVYNGKIGAVTTVQIPQSGIYIVSFVKDGKAVARKVRIL